MHDLAGVGENLHDHLQIRMRYEVRNTVTLNERFNSIFGKVGCASRASPACASSTRRSSEDHLGQYERAGLHDCGKSERDDSGGPHKKNRRLEVQEELERILLIS